MKSLYLRSLQIGLITAFALTAAPALAQDWTDYSYSFFIETSTSPIKIKGMEDVHVSDWQYFGTDASEGRMELPLSDGNTTNPVMPGAKMGFAGRQRVKKYFSEDIVLAQTFSVYQISRDS